MSLTWKDTSKFKAMHFQNFLGNERVKETVFSLFEAGRFPQAVLIEGEAGLGKKTLARDIAAMLVCTGEDKPCGRCAQCVKAQKGVHPDIFEYVPSGAVNSFHIETVRTVRDDASIIPNEAPCKIYILADCQCMNEAAQNAMLKLIEEPPDYAVFLLTVDSKAKLLPTVLSRCVALRLEGVCTPEAAALAAQLSGAEESDAKALLQTYGGNIGRTAEALKNGKLKKYIEICEKICYALLQGSAYQLMLSLAPFEKDRETMAGTISTLLLLLRDAAVLGAGGHEMLFGNRTLAEKLAGAFSRKQVLQMQSACREVLESVQRNANNAIAVTQLSCLLARAAGI